MRMNRVGQLAGLVLISAGLVTSAPAEQKRGGSAPAAAPHISAPPAPHISAPPAPHISAPAIQRFSAPPPRISAPAARFHAPSTPRFTVQRPAPRVTAPTLTTRHLATPPSTMRALRGTPSIKRQVSTPALRRRAITAAPGIEKRMPQVATPQVRKPSTIGQAPTERGRHLIPAAKLVRSPTGQLAVRNPNFSKPLGHDPASRSLAQSTFKGSFAKAGAWNKDWRWHRHGHRHVHFVIGFVGPVYWPYAYDDFIDYTFWPAAYDTFWPYAFDDLYEGIYGDYAPDIYPYVEGGGYETAYQPSARRGRTRVAAALPSGAAGPVCSGQAQGLTDLPIERIAQQVQPDEQQQALLDELRAATEQALQIMQQACPTELASTPTGRMDAMDDRVAAMLQALQKVQPALDKFYAALNDEQKERFNAFDAETQRSAAASPADIAQVCGSRAVGVTNLPFTRIEQSLRLTQAQAAALGDLKTAAAKASDILGQTCSGDQPLTPTGRLLAMEQRLNSLLEALDTVRPALAAFYNTLSDEQRARFNRLPPATS